MNWTGWTRRIVAQTRASRLITLGTPLPAAPLEPAADEPDWVQANPSWIARALARAQRKPTGGWYALGASREIGGAPRKFVVEGRELVLWRDGESLRAGPDTCPHMGAALSGGRVEQGRVVCPWHGLALGATRHGRWCPLPAMDDGVLAWVRLDNAETPTDAPILPHRPTRYLDGVIRIDARCAPEDVVANRLDPWHGVHYHPYSFARLRVLRRTEEDIVVRVAYRALGPVCVEVDARFHCPSARCITMSIEAGEGAGSVVETHATPLGPGRTAIIEATLATSDRPGFAWALRGAAMLRPFLERVARRLWVDDAAYAERAYQLRAAGQPEALPGDTALADP